MSKETEQKFLSLGFSKTTDNPLFLYEKLLISQETIDEYEIDKDDIPSLLFGANGVNTGFCIYTGAHFIWLSCGTPEEAIELSNQITNFESVL